MVLTYVTPTNLTDACALGREPGTVFLAGGTDVLVWRADGRRQVDRVVALRGLPELRERRWEDDNTLYLGAGITHAEVADDPELRRVFPALSEACRTVGSWSIRVAGTLGGNVCNAAPSADSAGPLLAYQADAVLADGEERREISLVDFFTGSGKTALRPGEILLGFRLPNPGRHGAAFVKLGRRQAMEIALVSATAVVRLGGRGEFVDLRLALGTAAPTPMLVEGTAQLARDRVLDEALLGEIAQLAMGQCRPRTGSLRCDADYRRRMVGVVAKRALRAAWDRADAQGGEA